MYKFNSKRFPAIADFIYLIAALQLLVFLTSCGSAPHLIEREIKVPYEIAVHDTIFLQDTVINQDTLWAGEVVDSLNNVIGWLKVFYSKKIAELKLNSRTDTITLKDTIQAKPKTNVIQEISGLLPFWAEVILMAVAIGLLALVNKGKIKNILKI